MDGESPLGIATIYRVGYVCLLVVSLASFLSIFEPDNPTPKRTKTQKKRVEEQVWPMFLTFTSTATKRKADTVGVSEGLVGGDNKEIKKADDDVPDPQVITRRTSRSSSASAINIEQSQENPLSADQKQEEIERLQQEVEKLQNQVKKESELRQSAEETLQFTQAQLRKEQDMVQLLRKKVLGLETKLYSEQPVMKLPSQDWTTEGQ